MFEVKYNRINAIVILDAFDRIPMVKDGKGDAGAMVSFMSDIKTFKEFRNAYNLADDKEEQLKHISNWNKYIQLRESEDFIPHFDSNNKLLYKSLF
ncbi:hypothetical protein [Mucilaginibacter sp.]|uniref:hypothetical protein n=1 Tax=Mucilaginibacter sp. TaxID=1882438 RepID=UPI0026254631|nr:hypothetical protein [Mucilaginibacter sp.]MDB5032240.1 hypothetical protein [Mucilaginibacter sp.]